MLTADELLAGSGLTYQIEVPSELLRPGSSGAPQYVRMRPLTIKDLQLISRAAKENDSLVAALMVQRALVEPELTVAQVGAMHAGLVHYLLEQVNRLSGITAEGGDVDAAMSEPLTRAAFALSEAFGWTPQQISEMTLAQVLLHLQLLREQYR